MGVLFRPVIKRLTSTAQQVIANECKGSIMREFPAQFLKTKVKDILIPARGGYKPALKAMKLLNQKCYKK